MGRESAKKKRKRSSVSSNPFLVASSSTSPPTVASAGVDTLVDHVLDFTASHKKESAAHLVNSLVDEDASWNSSTLTKTDVAVLLLPWAVQQAVASSSSSSQQNQEENVWKALSASLTVLKDSATMQKIVTQSVLFKLVPRAAVAAAAKDGGEADLAYKKLLELYHPVMDVACKTVLKHVLPLHGSSSSGSCTNNNSIAVLVSSLHWIHGIHFSRKGNPKTTFLLLSDCSVFSSFARAYSTLASQEEGQGCVRDILQDALFHHRHHMEGFSALLSKEAATSTVATAPPSETKKIGAVSTKPTESTAMDVDPPLMKKPSTFKSYHEELLATVTYCLSDENTDTQQIQDVLHLMPMMLRGFFEQAKEWDRRERESLSKGKKTSRGRKGVDGIQFQLFMRWAQLVRHWCCCSRSSNDNSNSICFLAHGALRRMLGLVLEFDAYTPSQHEHDKQYPFLQCIVSQLLTMPPSSSKRKDDNNMAVVRESITCLRLLLQLNYLLLHEHMTDAMLFCLKGGDETISVLIADFLAAMVDTYRLLRQQRHIFESLLGVATKLCEANSAKEILLLHDLLLDQKLTASIAVAVEASPILEVKQVFEITRSWIVDQSNSLQGGDFDSTQKSLYMAVRLTTTAIRNVRVDHGSASEIATVCQELVDGPVVALLKTETHAFMGAALTLCGFILDLHTRCIFWLGQNEMLRVPSKISDTLEACSNGSTHGDAQFQDGIVFLSCHRLRQLHSLIHDQEREEMESTFSLPAKNSSTLVDEATRLATFIAAQEIGLIRPGQRWVIVAHNYTSWIPYAQRNDVDLFLNWALSAATKSLPETALSGRSFDTDSMSKESQQSRLLDSEAEVAKCLLADASFCEHPEVSSRISVVGLSAAAHCISEVVALLSDYTKHRKELRLLTANPLHTDTWTRSTPAQLRKLVTEQHQVEVAVTPAILKKIESALRYILLVNGIACAPESEEDILDSLDLAMRLDRICRETFPSASVICSALRVSMYKMANNIRHAEAVKSFLGAGDHLGDLVCGLVGTAVGLLGSHGAAEDSAEAKQLIGSTGCLVELLLREMTGAPIDGSTVKALAAGFCRVKESTSSRSKESRALVSLTRHLLRGLRLSEWNALFPIESEDTTGRLGSIFDNCLDLATSLNRSLYPGSDRKFAPPIPAEEEAILDGYLLLGDLMCAHDAVWLPATGMLAVELQQICIEGFGRSRSDTFLEFSHIAGCLSKVHATPELSECIVDTLLAKAPENLNTDLLDAVFCHLISSVQDLPTVLRKLTTYASLQENDLMSSLGARLRLLQLVLRYTKEDQIKLLAPFGRDMFLLALRKMHNNTGSESMLSGSAVTACILLEDLLKRRDVYSFKERDLALILSYVSGVLGPCESVETTESTDEKDSPSNRFENNAVFLSMSDLVSTMFQRYTKQLYACVPSVVSALHCFLRHVMFARLPDDAIAERGLRFTRVCALLVDQKDIYKKHVIGLVLAFVQSLKNSSFSVKRRDSLIPAIYCLLDTMSVFETQQLNAHMDTKAKTLFRTIHQSYQKLHTYKGQ